MLWVFQLFCSLLLPSRISLLGCTTICLCIPWLMDTSCLEIISKADTVWYRFLLVCMFFFFLDQGVFAVLCGKCMFNYIGNCQTLPTWLHHFAFLPAVYESSSSCSASLIGLVSSLFNLLILLTNFTPNKSIIVSLCSFNCEFC